MGFMVISLLQVRVKPTNQAVHRNICDNNMKQIGLALHHYHEKYGSFPPAYIADENGQPMHSWRVLILPFMDAQSIYDQYDLDEPWDGPNNRKLWPYIPWPYTCPSAQSNDQTLTPYQVISGEGAVFNGDKSVSLSDIYDGTARTILVVEAASSPVIWTQPQDVSYNPDHVLHSALYSSNHDGRGPHVLFADGGVDYLEDVSSAELRSLIEKHDGVYHVR